MSDLGLPILPRKFLGCVARQTSPSPRTPSWRPHAGPAAGTRDQRPRLDKSLHGPVLQRLEVDEARPRRHDHPRPPVNLPPPENPERRVKVLQAAVARGPEKDLVDPYLLHFIDRFHIVDLVRAGDGGDKPATVNLHRPFAVGIRVRLERSERVLPSHAREPGPGHFVGGEEADFCSCLHGHVGDRHPAGHLETVDRGAAEFQGLVRGAGSPDPADEVEDDVFSVNAFGQPAGDRHPDRRGNAEPDLAQRHGRGGVGRADSRGEGSQGAPRAGV